MIEQWVGLLFHHRGWVWLVRLVYIASFCYWRNTLLIKNPLMMLYHKYYSLNLHENNYMYYRNSPVEEDMSQKNMTPTQSRLDKLGLFSILLLVDVLGYLLA